MSVEFKDYYTTLGVARDASAADIKKAFRKLARKHHPDVATDKKTAEAKFKEINEAHEVLSDPDKRKKYDRLGADWQSGGRYPPPRGGPAGGSDFQFGGTGFSDFFEQYFSSASRSGFPGGGQARSRRGGDVEGDVLVSLEEAMNGTIRPITLQTTNRQTGAAEKQTFKVKIPAGVTDGTRIRVAGQGEAGLGSGPAGDLFLNVRHSAHPEFTTDGADLIHELDLAPWEAVLGAEITVPSLDGVIKLRIPAGAENGQQLRVRGRGLPMGKSERGDFYVTLNLVIPDSLTREERTLWEKLRDGSSFRPR
jgi:curved DNA-binding protein